ncbi:nickel ABC transporter permease subunit NikC [Desulfosporosinus sp.]|uniref:nickel ABC transporter permease subunit NikC n=1 Tax=Desulfosporosinus sp. TaxID=157907 RepID=UPI002615793B|nr:nickel ABC transporter permease subunit NikC [Desulfosporosinus sp.]MCO5385277.1 nickel ABC transporter permease subunit NikC [Desulfosporosinus sp.]
MKRLCKDRLALIGLAIVGLIIAAGIFASYLAPNDPVTIDLAKRLSPADNQFPLGTDHLGRCILSRLLFGIRLSLGSAFLVLLAVMSISICIGTLSGYIGGRVDNLIMRCVDIILAFPGLILAMAVAGVLGPNLKNLMLAMVMTHWAGYARVVRGLVLSVKEKEFVHAARTCGTSGFKLVTRHILPNIVSPVIVLATIDMGQIILGISGLSFLGLGAQPPAPEWGAMLNDGRSYMQVAPQLMIAPGLSIGIVVLAFNLLGDGLRDAFDPRGTLRP